MTSDYTRLRASLDEPLSTVAYYVEEQSRSAARRLPAASRRILRSELFLVDALSEACAWFAANHDPARHAVRAYAYFCARKGVSEASRIHLGTRWRSGASRRVRTWGPEASLDSILEDGGDGRAFDLIVDSRDGAVHIARRRTERASESPGLSLDVVVATLRPLERFVVVMRFEHSLTFAEIGRTLGITREAVRIIARRAIERLRPSLPPDYNRS